MTTPRIGCEALAIFLRFLRSSWTRVPDGCSSGRLLCPSLALLPRHFSQLGDTLIHSYVLCQHEKCQSHHAILTDHPYSNNAKFKQHTIFCLGTNMLQLHLCCSTSSTMLKNHMPYLVAKVCRSYLMRGNKPRPTTKLGPRVFHRLFMLSIALLCPLSVRPNCTLPITWISIQSSAPHTQGHGK